MPPKPSIHKKEVNRKAYASVGRVHKPTQGGRTPVLKGSEALAKQGGGYYEDPKTKRVKQFKKQYKT